MFTIEERHGLPISTEEELKSLEEWLTVVPQEYVKNKQEEFLNIPLSFDIETTSYYDQNKEKCALRYCFVIGVYGRVFVGRTWEDFNSFLNALRKAFRGVLTIYVHNLSYEFQFIRKRFKWVEVFAVKSREVCYARTMNDIIFKCSYMLSGYSLAKVGEHLAKYKVQKKVGDLDYTLLRGSNTPLTEKEWGYVYNDGLVVMAYIQEEIEKNENDITKIPLTKTSYVRRYMRYETLFNKNGKSDNKFKNYRYIIACTKLEPFEFKMAHYAYMGGFTHANVFNSGQVKEDVTSMDFTSSYPSVMVKNKYPMGRGKDITLNSVNDFKRASRFYLMIFQVRYYGLKSRSIGDDIIPVSKCVKKVNVTTNNGRIMTADMIETVVTNVDFVNYAYFYTWDKVEFGKVYTYRADYLPTSFVKGVLKLYKDKTTLKGVKGKEVEYMASKENLNSCYGRCVTNICRPEYTYENDKWDEGEIDFDSDIDKYNTDKSRFLSYLWGVYVSAYARRNLFSAIYNLRDDYIYADTDSVKFMNYEKHKDYFDKYNANNEKRLKKAMDYHNLPYDEYKPKTIEGKEKILGAWDNDGHYKRFKTLGAKRYIVEEDDGSMEITISGVSKKCGREYLRYKYKTNTSIFNHFADQLVFPATYLDHGVLKEGSGKDCGTYLDDYHSGDFIDYLGYNNHWEELSSIFMEPTSYSLSMSPEYRHLLDGTYISGDMQLVNHD